MTPPQESGKKWRSAEKECGHPENCVCDHCHFSHNLKTTCLPSPTPPSVEKERHAANYLQLDEWIHCLTCHEIFHQYDDHGHFYSDGAKRTPCTPRCGKYYSPPAPVNPEWETKLKEIEEWDEEFWDRVEYASIAFKNSRDDDYLSALKRVISNELHAREKESETRVRAEERRKCPNHE